MQKACLNTNRRKVLHEFKYQDLRERVNFVILILLSFGFYYQKIFKGVLSGSRNIFLEKQYTKYCEVTNVRLFSRKPKLSILQYQ